jgi:transcriptional regulator with XRE-family HTH domain
MGTDEQSVRAVVGANVRRLREAAGARQDDVAIAARELGLHWHRSKVAALERGEKPIDLAELVLVAELLGELANQDIRLSDLLEGDGAVRLTSEVVVYSAALRRYLNGRPVSIGIPDVPGLSADDLHAGSAVMKVMSKRMSQLAGEDVNFRSSLKHVATSTGEAEERAGRVLGLSATDVASLAIGLWGRTLTEERDRRVGDGGSDSGRAARRGRVTRELVKDLRARLAVVTNGER